MANSIVHLSEAWWLRKLLRPAGGGAAYDGGGGQVVLPTPMFVLFAVNNTSGIELTNQADAEAFLVNSSRNIMQLDLTGFSEYRLSAQVVAASASANNPRLMARSDPDQSFSTAASEYSDPLGEVERALSLAATGLITTSWEPLRATAKADNFVTVIQAGGDGIADPNINLVNLQFR